MIVSHFIRTFNAHSVFHADFRRACGANDTRASDRRMHFRLPTPARQRAWCISLYSDPGIVAGTLMAVAPHVARSESRGATHAGRFALTAASSLPNIQRLTHEFSNR